MLRCDALCPEASARLDASGSSARKRPDDHELSRTTRGRRKVPRLHAVEEKPDVRPQGALFVDDAEMLAREAARRLIDRSSRSPSTSASDASPLNSSVTVSAPFVYDRNNPGILTCMLQTPQQASTA